MEESYGCLAGTYARDKDACVAVMMLCEVAAYEKAQGKTLCDAMEEMYHKYGYYKEGLATITKQGMDGAREIAQMMENKRKNPPTTLGGFRVLRIRDYLTNEIFDRTDDKITETGLPKSNVIYYELEQNAWCCVRPSGTEPKIKFYFGVKGKDAKDAQAKLEKLHKEIVSR